ncbi:Urb2/Npa2 family-domain-containing protein [Phaeosphaeriaceae sp. PMI808]|nr:Urb2/Npa2 family-domain-containing protein [Phaeosphaeriaceae sp. PMI808]
MAPVPPVHLSAQLPSPSPAPTRSRLQSINHDFSDLEEQIRQVAHIIHLPCNWQHLQDDLVRAQALRHVVRARAEWVLRWLLDKLKNEAAAGAGVRRAPTAWQLLECMLHILPISCSAPLLRDASFTTIIENTLADSFENAVKDISGHTTLLGTQLSRKRKRQTSMSSPSNTLPTTSKDPVLLFHIVTNVLKSITRLSTTNTTLYDYTQTELIKMILRTDSAQASRILKLWLQVVQRIFTSTLKSHASLQTLTSLLDLSLVIEIWDLRIIDSSDYMGFSSKEFANQCLVPTLQLIDALVNVRTWKPEQDPIRALDMNIHSLDKLLTRHIIAPSRAAFFATISADTPKQNSSYKNATALFSSLHRLRAVLLQAAHIEDAVQAIPEDFISVSKKVAYLLDLCIRATSFKTPKTRLMERPWIQAAFLSLVECAGCSLHEPPEPATSRIFLAVLKDTLKVLEFHNIAIDTSLLRNIFWYHCGIKPSQSIEIGVEWDLVATLIRLDASIFVAEPRMTMEASKERSTDLAKILFDHISFTEVHATKNLGIELVKIETAPKPGCHRNLLLNHILVPLMFAFSRNRNLLGFIRRWDAQLVKSYTFDNRKYWKKKYEPIWEDRIITTALSELLETSLTQGQVTQLIKEHINRIDTLSGVLTMQADNGDNVHKHDAHKEASSSAVIVYAVLQSIRSDDVVILLKLTLHSLLVSYATRVRDKQIRAHTSVAFSWFALCQLITKLWPIEIHASLQLQQALLYPLMEQASEDMLTNSKATDSVHVDSVTRAAATLFLLDACDRLQTVPGVSERVEKCLHKIVENFSNYHLESQEQKKTVEVFCVNFVQLLSHLDAQVSRESFLTILAKLATLDGNDAICGYLTQAVFEQGNSILHQLYASALSDTLSQDDEHRLHDVAVKALLHIQPSALSREKREAILDRLSALLSKGSPDAVGLLAGMVRLMEVPNASAAVSSNGAVIFNIAAQLQRQRPRSHTLLQQLQRLCQMTLGHIIPNQNQSKNRALLGEYQKGLDKLAKDSSIVSATGLAILRATILEQKDSQLLSIKHYVSLLKQCLTDDSLDTEDSASLVDILDAFNELGPTLLGDAALFNATATWLRKWSYNYANLESYISSTTSSTREGLKCIAQLHTLLTRYKLYPNAKWLVTLTVKVARESVADEAKRSMLVTLTDILTPFETTEKLDLVPLLTDVQDPLDQSASYNILNGLLSTLPDKLAKDSELQQKQLAILPRLGCLLAEASDEACFNALMDSINTILNDKTALTTQHSAECILSALVKLTSRTSPALSANSACHIFTRICETSRLVLLVHRGRLGGRFHLLLPLLQGLLFCIFTPTSSRSGALPSWLRCNMQTEPVCLSPLNASQYSRLLSTLCNPPQSSILKNWRHSQKAKHLVDVTKSAREKTSHFVYPLLASFCRFQLFGRLAPAVRAKLLPGVWEVVSIAILDKEGLDAMFAGLNRSEKDVWRGVWGEWESVHGRKERALGSRDT